MLEGRLDILEMRLVRGTNHHQIHLFIIQDLLWGLDDLYTRTAYLGSCSRSGTFDYGSGGCIGLEGLRGGVGERL